MTTFQTIPHDVVFLILQSAAANAGTDRDLQGLESFIFSCRTVYSVYKGNQHALTECLKEQLYTITRDFPQCELMLAQREYSLDPEHAPESFLIPMAIKVWHAVHSLGIYDHGQNSWSTDGATAVYKACAYMYAERRNNRHGRDMAEFDNFGREYNHTSESVANLLSWVERQIRDWKNEESEEGKDLLKRLETLKKRDKRAEKGSWRWIARLADVWNKCGEEYVAARDGQPDDRHERMRRRREGVFRVLQKHPLAEAEAPEDENGSDSE